jgi:hypothetical protein
MEHHKMEKGIKRRKSSRYRYKQLSPETKRMIEINKERMKDLTEEEFLDLLPKYIPLSDLERQLKIEEKVIAKKESDIEDKIENFLHSEENQPIVLESEYTKMIQNLGDFYNINISPVQMQDFIHKMNHLLIDHNKDLYIKDNNIYYSKSLLFLSEIKVPQKQFANILLNLGIKYYDKSNVIPENELFQTSFPIIQLCNLVINSSKLLFSYVLEEESIVLENYSSNFETNNLGSIFYTQYFSDKYRDVLCSVGRDSIQELLDQSKKINDFIETFYDDFLDYVEKFLKSKNMDLVKMFWEKYGSFYNSYYLLILLYISRINDTINTNGYIFELLKRAGEEISENIQMLFDDRRPKYQKLFVSKRLNEKILECLKGNQSYILIPLDITRESWGNDTHQNILLVDIKRKLVERYEPHGSISMKKDEDINSEIWWFFLSLGFQYKYDLCSVSSIQDIEKQFIYELGGKCVSLTYGYLDHRLSLSTQKNQGLPPEFAPISYYNLANEKGVMYWYDLNILNSKIFTELQPYLDQINEYFDSNLLFKRNTLTFIN